MTKKRITTDCAVWAEDANGKPYPKEALDENGKPYAKGFKGKKQNITWADQSFKESSNINTIIDKAKRTGTLAHINEHAQFYADMTEFDYETARNEIARTDSAFYELSAEVRAEFNNDPGKFRNWAAPLTAAEVAEKIPELAQPGKQFPDVVGGTSTEPSPPADAGSPPDPGGRRGSNK